MRKSIIFTLAFLVALLLTLAIRAQSPQDYVVMRAWEHVRRGARELWTPADLGSSLALWLDAQDNDTFTLDSTSVTQWRDKSGNARHASAAGTARPVIATNTNMANKQVVYFDGANDQLDLVTFAQVSGQQIFMAGDTARISTDSRVFLDRTSASVDNLALYFGGSATSYRPDVYWNGGFRATQADVVRRAALFWWEFTVGDPTSTSTASTRVDAANLVSSTFTASEITSWASIANGSVQQSAFDAGEILITASLSEADRQRAEGFLAHKWGLTANLPSGHPYKNAPPYKTAYVYPSGLVAYYSMDSRSGDDVTVFDTFGSNDGTAVNAPAFGTAYGKYLEGVGLNGSSQYIESNADITGLTGASAFAWINIKQFPAAGQVFSQRLAGGEPDWQFFVSDTIGEKARLRIDTSDSTTTLDSGVLPINTWIHIGWTYNDPVMRVYVNGQKASEVNHSSGGAILSRGFPFAMGASSGGDFYFNGSLDEIAIWNRALSSNEIEGMYDQQKNGEGFYTP